MASDAVEAAGQELQAAGSDERSWCATTRLPWSGSAVAAPRRRIGPVVSTSQGSSAVPSTTGCSARRLVEIAEAGEPDRLAGAAIEAPVVADAAAGR
jgi:hypothetical protein